MDAELPIQIISQSTQLHLAVQDMSESREIGLDTESNSFHHYPEQLCLIQVSTKRRIYLIDTIVLEDLVPFERVLENESIMKVIHGADYDIRSLDRFGGFRVCNLYDTSIAARFAGITQFGLAALLKDLLGISINKSNRLQRSDWGRRPLSAEACNYAAEDVLHLSSLQRLLRQRLEALKRGPWVAEECERLEEVRFSAPDLETAHLSMKGTHGLNGRGLAILKSLLAFRDKEAIRRGRPPFFVIPDNTLILLASNLSSDMADVPGLNMTTLERLKPGLEQAINEGLSGPPVLRPPTYFKHVGFKQIQLQNKRMRQLKDWRAAIGTSLSLDPSLLWPTASLERLAENPDSLETELGSDVIRRWQRENFALSLGNCLKTLH